jgi:uncharacterized protein with predicted RNA binding PUA domain
MSKKIENEKGRVCPNLDASHRESGGLLKTVRTIADYQFGKGAGKALFSENVEFIFSSKGGVRQILEGGARIATLRAQDGFLTLGIGGGKRLHSFFRYPKRRVVVSDDAAPFVAQGKSAFAKYVEDCDKGVRAHEEVLLVDRKDKLLATGTAVLCSDEMRSFKRGVAVKVRETLKLD